MKRGFTSLHPFTIFFYFMGFVFLNMILLHPVYLLAGIVGMTFVNYCTDRGQQLISFLPYYLLIGVTIAIANPLFSHRGRHILLYFLNQPITLESVMYGITMMLSLFSILFSFVAYNQVLTSGKFLFIFSKAFQKIGLLVMLAVRFVPLVKRRMSQIMTVQRTRGVNPFEGKFHKRLKDAMLVLQVLVTWSLEEALQTADSMKARGYGILYERSSYNPYRFRLIDAIIFTILIATISICITGWLSGYGVLHTYPKLEWVSFNRTQWFIFTCFLVYTVVPLIVEGREKVKWQSWK